MPDVHPRDEVRGHFESLLDPATGLLPLDKVVDVVAKLGRPGLKLKQFQMLVNKLGIELDEHILRSVFLLVDIDQSFVLDDFEIVLGMSILIKQKIPDLVLQMSGLSTEQIVRSVISVVTLTV